MPVSGRWRTGKKASETTKEKSQPCSSYQAENYHHGGETPPPGFWTDSDNVPPIQCDANTNRLPCVPTYTLPLTTVGTGKWTPAPRPGL